MPAPADTTTTQDQQGQTQQTQQGTNTQQQTQQSQTPQQQQTSQQQQSSQRPGADQNPGNDDRSRGLIADLQKERQARQRLEQQFHELQGHLDAERRRIQALAGVTPQSPEEQELEAVRARVVQLFPVLAKLDEEQLDQLLSLNERAGGFEEVAQNHWERHGRTMLSSLQSKVAEELGTDLSDRQQKALARAYVAEAETNPEFLKRHEAGDQTLIEEFAKQWVEDWFEPARKTVVTSEVNRMRRVPSGRDRSVQTTPPKKIDFKDAKAVEDAMVESFRSHGGRFDN